MFLLNNTSSNLYNASFALAGIIYFFIYYFTAVNNIFYTPLLEVECLIALLSRYRLLLVWALSIPRLVNSVAIVYGFETAFDFIYNASQNYSLGLSSYVYVGTFVIVFFLINLIVAFRLSVENVKSGFKFIPILVVFVFILLQIENKFKLNFNLVGMPWTNYYHQYKNFTTQAPRFYDVEQVYDAHAVGSKNVYLFLMESHTLFKSEELSSALYSNIRSNIIRQKINAKFGSTFRGELRELCSIIAYPDVSSGSVPAITHCLPQLLSNTHRTVALHGGAKGMYKRNSIYPKIGFKEYYSLQDLDSVESCGGGWKNFPCDVNVLKYYEEKIKDQRSTFLYFLTINTHNPYQLTTYAINSCPKSIVDDVEMCNHYRNIAGFMSYVYEFSTRNPGVYILAGDHPPPLLKKYYSSDYYERIIFESK